MKLGCISAARRVCRDRNDVAAHLLSNHRLLPWGILCTGFSDADRGKRTHIKHRAHLSRTRRLQFAVRRTGFGLNSDFKLGFETQYKKLLTSRDKIMSAKHSSSSFFGLEDDQRKLNSIQSQLRTVIRQKKAYVSDIGSNIESFSLPEFETEMQELDSAQKLYEASRKLEIRRDQDLSALETSQTELMEDLSVETSQLAALEQSLRECTFTASQLTPQRETLESQIQHLNGQIVSLNELSSKLSTYYTSFSGASFEIPDDIPSEIENVREAIPGVVSEISRMKAIIADHHDLHQSIKFNFKQIAKDGKAVEMKIALRRHEKDAEIRRERERLAKGLQQLKAAEDAQAALEIMKGTRIETRQAVYDRIQETKANRAAVLESQKSAKARGSSLESQIETEQTEIAEWAKRLAQHQEKIAQKCSRVEASRDSVLSETSTVSGEIDSTRTEIGSERRKKSDYRQMKKLIFDLVSLWQDIGVQYDDLEKLNRQFHALHESELDQPEVNEPEPDHSLSLEVLENEKAQIEGLVKMIQHMHSRKAKIAKKQEAALKEIGAVLRINPELYSPSNPRSIGRRNQKEIVRDLRARKTARMNVLETLQSEISRKAAKFASLEERLPDRRDKVSRKRDALLETEMRAGIETNFELDGNQRFALRSVLSLIRSIRREIQYWSKNESPQARSLLESWKICLDASVEEFKGALPQTHP
jgi:chromosome segregation ATPase